MNCVVEVTNVDVIKFDDDIPTIRGEASSLELYLICLLWMEGAEILPVLRQNSEKMGRMKINIGRYLDVMSVVFNRFRFSVHRLCAIFKGCLSLSWKHCFYKK